MLKENQHNEFKGESFIIQLTGLPKIKLIQIDKCQFRIMMRNEDYRELTYEENIRIVNYAKDEGFFDSVASKLRKRT